MERVLKEILNKRVMARSVMSYGKEKKMLIELLVPVGLKDRRFLDALARQFAKFGWRAYVTDDKRAQVVAMLAAAHWPEDSRQKIVCNLINLPLKKLTTLEKMLRESEEAAFKLDRENQEQLQALRKKQRQELTSLLARKKSAWLKVIQQKIAAGDQKRLDDLRRRLAKDK